MRKQKQITNMTTVHIIQIEYLYSTFTNLEYIFKPWLLKLEQKRLKTSDATIQSITSRIRVIMKFPQSTSDFKINVTKPMINCSQTLYTMRLCEGTKRFGVKK
jgi:hypothetical protein